MKKGYLYKNIGLDYPELNDTGLSILVDHNNPKAKWEEFCSTSKDSELKPVGDIVLKAIVANHEVVSLIYDKLAETFALINQFRYREAKDLATNLAGEVINFTPGLLPVLKMLHEIIDHNTK